VEPSVNTRAVADCPAEPAAPSYYEIFHCAGDAFLALNKGVVVDCNLRAMNLFEARCDQLLGRSLPDLYPPEKRNSQDSGIPASCEPVHYQSVFRRPDGTRFDAAVTLSQLRDRGSSWQLAILRPLPEVRAEAEDLLKECADQLGSVNSELYSIYFAVSHDLRAAIRGIAACSQIVIDDYGTSLNEEAKRWVKHIHEDAEQLDRATEALLELSRIAGAVLHPAVLDLTAIVREIVGNLGASAPSRNVRFEVREGMEARGDGSLVRTLLRNLLENAWKFTSKTPGAKIEFGCLESDSEPKVFYVRDNGAGFDMADEDRLFVAFQRLHRDEGFAGNGVGLATVRRIAHRHGGKTWAVGEPGLGATFLFTLGR
jgi:signal transduction histidine kinase